MIRLLVYAIIGISLLYIFTEIIKFLTAISGTRNEMDKDKNKFLSTIDQSSLIEWPLKEVTTLSMDLDYGTSKYDMITSAQDAAFLSIYDEKVGHMMSKTYGEKELMFIVTKENKFELYRSDNQKVILTLDDKKSVDVDFSSEELKFQIENTNFKLTQNGNRGEIYINGESKLITNENTDLDESMRRLVPIVTDEINPNDSSVVKFLLLFYLIWRQESN